MDQAPDDDTLRQLAASLGERLRAERDMLVTAESCTGGWIAKAMTDVAGSSEWFDCGMVAYSYEAKQALLGVRAETLEVHGAVSRETVVEMVSGALVNSGATVAVAVTGIAGPGGGTVENPSEALEALAALPVRPAEPQSGYDRSLFGSAWTDEVTVDLGRNGCDTRNDVLRRDLTNKVLKADTNGCLVLSGLLKDPYSGNEISFVRGTTTSTAVQIDHIVALSNAWQTGAQQLTFAKRKDFANDPLNLWAVDGPLNMQKSDGDAATWLPPNTSIRCDYVSYQVAVKDRYNLWMTTAEKQKIADIVTTSCPTKKIPTSHDVPAARR